MKSRKTNFVFGFFFRGLSGALNRTIGHGNKHDKLFFFFSQKTTSADQSKIEELIEKCEKLIEKCDELKVDINFVSRIDE